MSSELVGILSFVVLFGLMATGLPIHICFVITAMLFYVYFTNIGAALSLVGIVPFSWANNYVLTAVPLFILMGQFVFQSRISKQVFDAANMWLGHLPGGLSLATLGASTALAATTGSSIASAATMASIALPEMKRYGYNDSIATGTVAAGGTLAILIPPSIAFIIFGAITEVSVGKLFLAGVFPGLMFALMFMIMIIVIFRLNPSLGSSAESFTWRERFVCLKGIWPIVVIFMLVIGGLYLGLFTPTEAGAIGALGSLVMITAKRVLNIHILSSALLDTVKTTGMIFVILISAMMYNNVIAVSGLPAALANWVANLNLNPYYILVVIILLYIPLGMFMDTLPMIVLTVPIFFPVVTGPLGFDPLLFGVIIVVVMEMGLITPPIGMNVFVIKGVAENVPLEKMFIGIIPFVVTLCIGLVPLIAFPEIALFLPRTMR